MKIGYVVSRDNFIDIFPISKYVVKLVHFVCLSFLMICYKNKFIKLKKYINICVIFIYLSYQEKQATNVI